MLTKKYLCKHLHHIYDINVFNEAPLISSVNVTLAGYVAGLDQRSFPNISLDLIFENKNSLDRRENQLHYHDKTGQLVGTVFSILNNL